MIFEIFYVNQAKSKAAMGTLAGIESLKLCSIREFCGKSQRENARGWKKLAAGSLLQVEW